MTTDDLAAGDRGKRSLRELIEAGFFGLGHWAAGHPGSVSLVMVLIALALTSRIPGIVMDTSTEGFLHDRDPVLLEYNAFRDQFGRDELVVIAIDAGDVFSLESLRRLVALHRDLAEQVPHLDDITSLVNARDTRGEGDSLIVEDLLEGLFDQGTPDAAALQAVRDRALANPLYRNTLLSEDSRVATILIKTDTYSSAGAGNDDEVLTGFDDQSLAGIDGADPDALDAFDDRGGPGSQAGAGPGSGSGKTDSAGRPYLTDVENGELVKAVYRVVERHQADGFRIYVAGSPVATDELKSSMQTNIKRFMLLILVMIALILWLLFRRLSGVLLPLLVVFLSLLSTLGIMALVGIPFKLPTQILPSFLIAVGVGASVHLLVIFFRRLDRQSDPAGEQGLPGQGQLSGRPARRQAIADAMAHSGLAVVMTSLTTAAGLASFAGAETAPIADLGLVAAIGVLMGLPYVLILMPALLGLLPIAPRRPKRAGVDPRHDAMGRLLEWIAGFAVRRYRLVLGLSAVIIAVGLAGAVQVRFSHAPHKWLSPDNPVRQANDFVDSHLNGASSLEVVVDTGEENGLYLPERMSALAGLAGPVEAIDQGELKVGKTLSVADILKETHQALNENRPAYYKIPDDRLLIAQELLLFENSGSDDLEDFVDSGFRQARFTIRMPWVDSVLYGDFIDDLKERFGAAFGDQVGIVATGMIPLLSRTMYATILTMAESYLIAGGVIMLMMVLVIGSIRLGLVSMVPNLAPIVLTIGLMGWLGLPMDLFTILIGSIAIGLAVDDTIHFFYNFRRYHHRESRVDSAIRLTLGSTGRAMLVTTVVLSLGFFLYMFSNLSNLFNFGLLTGFTIILALLADVFLAPALMVAMDRRGLLPSDRNY